MILVCNNLTNIQAVCNFVFHFEYVNIPRKLDDGVFGCYPDKIGIQVRVTPKQVLKSLFRSSSMVEHPAVNRRVTGSSPVCGAKSPEYQGFLVLK